MLKEIWKAVEGYEGLFEVSNLGRIRSLDRVIIHSDGRKRLFKGQIIKQAAHTNGYYFIYLCTNRSRKYTSVHRLVAETFLPNPNNLPEVNHKDENKANNCVFVNKDGSVDLNKSNLEWCTHSYNMRYGTGSKRSAEKRKILLLKPVLQIDKNTNEIIDEYPSIKEAARRLNIDQGNISKCCKDKRKTAYGYKWQYQD